MDKSGFWQGVAEFNQQQFYACHDTLEALWMDSTEPDKSFYQGVLQIAVGCYHLTNYNWRGAVILLGEGTRKLRDYQPDYEDIDVEQLVIDSISLLQTLQQTQPEQLPQLLGENGEQIALQFPKIARID
jgi:predicted metal-dependent hydrolase